MINVLSTTDLITVTTSAIGAISVHASYVDLNGTTVTPGRTNTASITTAITTTVVAAPGASTYRNVKFLSIVNTSATVQNTVTVSHSNGSIVEQLTSALLGANEVLLYAEGAGWQRVNGAGTPITAGTAAPVDIQTFTTSATPWTKPTTFTPTTVLVHMWGQGGGGGAGASLASLTTVAKGGGGGGGGAYLPQQFAASELGATESIGIPTATNGGVPGAIGVAGGDGGAGANTTFGTTAILTAFGGGGGRGGAISALATGGGGGGGAGGLGGV